MSKVYTYGTPDAQASRKTTSLLWHIPDKPDNISIGRQRIAEGLAARGFNVTTTTTRKEHLKKQLQDGYDVVMSTSAAGGVFGPLTRVRDQPYIVDYVDPITQMFKSADYTTARMAKTLQSLSFRTADAITYVYESEADRVERYDAPSVKTSLGVDIDMFANPSYPTIEAAKTKLNKAGIGSDCAIYIGGLEEIYNIPTLLDAAETGDFELAIAGTGEYRHEVERAARENDNIGYLGLVDHDIVPGLLHHAGCGVCLVDDPHTVKVLEYGAAGLPVVHATGRAEGVLPDTVGFTDITAESVADAIETMLTERVDTQPLTEYARERTWKRVVDDYEKVIWSVV